MAVDLSAADHLQLLIEDTGSGPPAQIATTIFEPFVSGKRDGIGLGLAVAREVVTDHHGSIRWERTTAAWQPDATGTGESCTRFLVELPLAEERTNGGESTGR